MKKLTAIKTLILECTSLIDKGEILSIGEIEKHFEEKNLVEWLAKQYPFGSDLGIDLSLFTKAHHEFVNESYYKYWGGYVGSERRKWGISNNGLCLIISWGLEIIRDIVNDGTATDYIE